MSKRIWEGRCEDCYDKKTLNSCSDDTVPAGIKAELCEECTAQRRKIKHEGHEPPPLGLLIKGTWKDIPPVSIRVGGKLITTSVKFLSDGDNAGITRLRFDDRPQWFAAGVFGRSPDRALSEVKHFLRMFYFPNQPIQFV